jgi:hypothetical protein
VRDTDTGLWRAISREQAWRILKEVFHSNELSGKLGTHAMRKTFANRVYEKLNHDLVKSLKAMGHANIHSTVSSLSGPLSAAAHRLPTLFHAAASERAGGLMSYYPDLTHVRRVVGAKP